MKVINSAVSTASRILWFFGECRDDSQAPLPCAGLKNVKYEVVPCTKDRSVLPFQGLLLLHVAQERVELLRAGQLALRLFGSETVPRKVQIC